jgi:hypothetical protein
VRGMGNTFKSRKKTNNHIEVVIKTDSENWDTEREELRKAIHRINRLSEIIYSYEIKKEVNQDRQ